MNHLGTITSIIYDSYNISANKMQISDTKINKYNCSFIFQN